MAERESGNRKIREWGRTDSQSVKTEENSDFGNRYGKWDLGDK